MHVEIIKGKVTATADTIEDIKTLLSFQKEGRPQDDQPRIPTLEETKRKPYKKRKREKSNTKWTPLEDTELLELYTSGKKMSEIAHALKRTTSAIGMRLWTLRKVRPDVEGLYVKNRETANNLK